MGWLLPSDGLSAIRISGLYSFCHVNKLKCLFLTAASCLEFMLQSAIVCFCGAQIAMTVVAHGAKHICKYIYIYVRERLCCIRIGPKNNKKHVFWKIWILQNRSKIDIRLKKDRGFETIEFFTSIALVGGPKAPLKASFMKHLQFSLEFLHLFVADFR